MLPRILGSILGLSFESRTGLRVDIQTFFTDDKGEAMWKLTVVAGVLSRWRCMAASWRTIDHLRGVQSSIHASDF
jgi:hypothetical protein